MYKNTLSIKFTLFQSSTDRNWNTKQNINQIINWLNTSNNSIHNDILRYIFNSFIFIFHNHTKHMILLYLCWYDKYDVKANIEQLKHIKHLTKVLLLAGKLRLIVLKYMTCAIKICVQRVLVFGTQIFSFTGNIKLYDPYWFKKAVFSLRV